MAVTPAPAAIRPTRFRRFRLTRVERRNLRWGLLFISPWLFGFIVFGIFPILYTFFLSLTRYSGIKPPILIGIANYQRMVADPLFLKAAYNTLYYTFLAVPVAAMIRVLREQLLPGPVSRAEAAPAMTKAPLFSRLAAP